MGSVKFVLSPILSVNKIDTIKSQGPQAVRCPLPLKDQKNQIGSHLQNWPDQSRPVNKAEVRAGISALSPDQLDQDDLDYEAVIIRKWKNSMQLILQPEKK